MLPGELNRCWISQSVAFGTRRDYWVLCSAVCQNLTFCGSSVERRQAYCSAAVWSAEEPPLPGPPLATAAGTASITAATPLATAAGAASVTAARQLRRQAAGAERQRRPMIPPQPDAAPPFHAEPPPPRSCTGTGSGYSGSREETDSRESKRVVASSARGGGGCCCARSTAVGEAKVLPRPLPPPPSPPPKLPPRPLPPPLFHPLTAASHCQSKGELLLPCRPIHQSTHQLARAQHPGPSRRLVSEPRWQC